jgi:hypothetical protein
MRELLKEQVFFALLYLWSAATSARGFFLGLNSPFVFIRVHSRFNYPIDLFQTERVGAWSEAADDGCHNNHTKGDKAERAD